MVNKTIITMKSKPKQLLGEIVARQWTPNLINFVPPTRRTYDFFRKRTRKGYKYPGVKAKTYGGQTSYDGSFVIPASNGGHVVAKRKGKSRKAKLEWVYGPSIVKSFESKKVSNRVIQLINRELPSDVNDALIYEMSK